MSASLATLPLKHAGQAQGVMLTDTNQLLEVQQYKQMYSAWFARDRLIAGERERVRVCVCFFDRRSAKTTITDLGFDCAL